MIESHDKLKELRKSQKTLQSSKSEDQEKLDNLEVRQQNLRAEVDKVRKRKEIQDKIKLLEKAIVFVEYNIARALHNELKAKAQATEQKLKELERRIEPLMRSVNEKQEYQQQIEVVIKERKRALQHAERAADQALEKIQILEKNIAGNEADITSRKQNDAKRKADVNDLQKKIREIDARLANPPPEFNASTWNERIREKGASRNPLRAEQAQLGEADRLLIEQGTRVLNARKEAEQELASLESQAGQQASKIGKFSVDVQKAWKWVQEHMDEFEKEVYGPPMITCSIKDPRYLDQLEAVVGRNSLLTITTQTSADNRKLAIKLKELGLLKVRYVRATGNIERKPMWTDQQLKENGLDVWAFDLIDGPDPVLDMIFSGRNRTPLGLKDISEEQLERMQKSSIRFIAGRTFYTTTYRPEYDAGSTSTRGIKNAFMWTDAPVDKAASRELERKIQELSTEFERMQAEVRPHRVRMGAIKEEIETIGKEVEELNQSKAAEQKLRGQYNALPTRKEQFQENLASRKREGEQVQQQMREVRAEWDKNVIEKAEVGLQYKDLVAQIRTCHEELLDAEVRRIEAISDVDALKEKNAENARKLDEGKRAAAEARRLSDIEKGKARRSLEAVKILLAEAQEDGTDHYFQVECADKTIDGIQNEMAAEKAKLELIHASNPNAIRDFEERQRQLDKLQEKMARVEEELGNVDTEITEVRGQWEPELDKLVLEISEAFAFNFERIGCNGEVGIRKEEDFDLWAIEIRVKFRENETLQILDAHRQSGGERSVSTIFYLMALQSLAKSPFRVVDEINQGMDPRNERMVHERMVEIACQEHTSQYFLITPKLLTGLRYDRRMKVLCIASGEYMPKDYKSLNVSKIIGMRRAVLAAR
ncbi:RecF/RecN/SMC N terminal domain-containing protein [Phlyctema vagabunda]|uniref:Structural maintenance of chromosomes protein 5 n=1 Tax=Phlyctema vagabunda TaxID=108571 RepID=A0ABR4PG72_9HELO